jgi:hypothetical protein
VPRRAYTARERTLIKSLAAEELSISRTVLALAELYNIKTTPSSLGTFASRQKIKFFGQSGAPYGNTNRTGKPGRTQEEKKIHNRNRMRTERQQGKRK